MKGTIVPKYGDRRRAGKGDGGSEGPGIGGETICGGHACPVRRGLRAGRGRTGACSQKQKTPCQRHGVFCFGGSGWIRTTEVVDNRFTVCPLWPLGNAPI